MNTRSESGAILIHVAVALLCLIGFTAFVVDYGLMMVGRTEAQNAADSGALAGATAMVFDGDLREDDGPAKTNAYRFATGNYVMGQAPDVINPATGDHTDVKFYPDEPAAFPGECVDNNCIRVDVYRNEERGNPLPMWFGQLFGFTQQGVKATATARASDANYTECLKPWLIPDKFTDVNGNGEYNTGDVYVNPGWTEADIGTTLLLNPGSPHDAVAPSHFFQVDVNNYYDDIVGCELVKGIGDTIDTAPGGSNGLTKNGVEQLIANNGGDPVTVIIGMFSPIEFEASRQTGHFDLTIVNMMGFEIVGMKGKALYGTIVAAPGEMREGSGTGGGLIKKIGLIR